MDWLSKGRWFQLARPIKHGLDYFPLDVDIDQDDKFQLVEALHGIKGFGITIKLLMRIYKEGFYYHWTETEQILFSKRVNEDINLINEVVNDCIKYSLFDEGMYKQYQILTSRGIQLRYFEAVTRRKSVKVEESYLLVNPSEYSNLNKTVVNVNNNPTRTVVNEDIGTQSKGKESKGENKTAEKPPVHQDELFEEWWNTYGKKVGDKKKCRTKYKSLLKKNTHESIIEGTKRYKRYLQTLKESGEFAPSLKHPYTFLNGENFNDEYEFQKEDTKPSAPKYQDLGGREY